MRCQCLISRGILFRNLVAGLNLIVKGFPNKPVPRANETAFRVVWPARRLRVRNNCETNSVVEIVGHSGMSGTDSRATGGQKFLKRQTCTFCARRVDVVRAAASQFN